MSVPKFKLLFIIIFFPMYASSQIDMALQKIKKKTFLSSQLEYLEILNDSTLYSSINSYTDTAIFFIKKDTLYINQSYFQSDGSGTKQINKLYDYPIIRISQDSIILKNFFRFNYKPDEWEDTLVFVNIEKIKESTENFQYLKLNIISVWRGAKHISIDKNRNVVFSDKPIPYSIDNPGVDKNAKPKNIKGELTEKEFKVFKNLLSKSMISKLAAKRPCPIDGSTANFQIMLGNKLYKSSGCELSWTQSFLLNYLYDIDKNKGLIKSIK